MLLLPAGDPVKFKTSACRLISGSGGEVGRRMGHFRIAFGMCGGYPILLNLNLLVLASNV